MLGPNGEEYNISDANVEAAGGSRGGDNSSLLQGKAAGSNSKALFCFISLLPSSPTIQSEFFSRARVISLNN